MIDSIALKWRNLLISAVESYPSDTPLLLSGGMDSSTVLAALLELGRTPIIYHFQLGTNESSDFHNVMKMRSIFNLEVRIIPIKNNEDILINDIKSILQILKTTHPTAVQTTHPLIYILNALLKDGFTSAIDGVPGIVDLTRKSKVMWGSKSTSEVQQYRKDLAGAPGQGSYGNVGIEIMANFYNVLLLHPYLYSSLSEYGLSLTMDELNSPVQKGISQRAFPDFYKHSFWKSNQDLQVASGLKFWHESLLGSTYNKRGSRKIVGVYNQVLREMFSNIIAGGGGTLTTTDSPFYKIMTAFTGVWPRLPDKGGNG